MKIIKNVTMKLGWWVFACALALLPAPAASQQNGTRKHIFFMRAPTSPQTPTLNVSWHQQDPASFSVDSFRAMMGALGDSLLPVYICVKSGSVQ